MPQTLSKMLSHINFFFFTPHYVEQNTRMQYVQCFQSCLGFHLRSMVLKKEKVGQELQTQKHTGHLTVL